MCSVCNIYRMHLDTLCRHTLETTAYTSYIHVDTHLKTGTRTHARTWHTYTLTHARTCTITGGQTRRCCRRGSPIWLRAMPLRSVMIRAIMPGPLSFPFPFVFLPLSFFVSLAHSRCISLPLSLCVSNPLSLCVSLPLFRCDSLPLMLFASTCADALSFASLLRRSPSPRPFLSLFSLSLTPPPPPPSAHSRTLPPARWLSHEIRTCAHQRTVEMKTWHSSTCKRVHVCTLMRVLTYLTCAICAF